MADEKHEDLFPALPEDLAGLSDEDIQALRAEYEEAGDKIEANDAEFIGERTPAELLAAYDEGLEALEAIVTEQRERKERERNYAAEMEARKAKRQEVTAADEPEPEPEPDDGDDDGAESEEKDKVLEVVAEAEEATEEAAEKAEEATEEVEKERKLVLASAPKLPRRVPQSRPAPSPETEGKSILRATGGLGAVTAGEILDTEKLVAALIEANNTGTARQGFSEKVKVAHAEIPYPPERRLDNRDAISNSEKIMAVMPQRLDRESLVASGGLCAPLTPFYDLPVLSVANRPVKNSLPSFQAARGGVSVPSAISMADVSAGVDIVTASQDEAAGTDVYPKACLDVTCDPYTDYEISMIYACVTHGNLGARSWPERVRAVAELQAAWHARVAEGNLLDGIAAASTSVTVSATYGAVSSVLNAILAAGDGMRSRHRLNPNTRLRALLPDWARSLLVADLVNSQFNRFDVSIEGVQELLSRIGRIDAVFYLDEAAGAGQIFGAESGGALDAWPTNMVGYLYPEGSFLFLDQGTLDLGIVRDSVLNSTNDFQSFMETFEGIAFVGIESLELTFTICPTGTVAAPASAASCPFFD